MDFEPHFRGVFRQAPLALVAALQVFGLNVLFQLALLTRSLAAFITFECLDVNLPHVLLQMVFAFAD